MTESKKDWVLNKVRKLLAMAEAGNQSEAEAEAMAQKAQELLTKYQLEMTEVEVEEAADERVEQDAMYFEKGTRVTTWKAILCQYVAEANSCSVFKVPGRETYEGTVRGKVVIVGKPGNAAAARYLAMSFINTVDNMGKAFVRRHGGGKRAGNSFRLGMVRRIGERLEEAQKVVRAAPGVTTVALARLDNEARQVETYVRLNLNLRTTKNKYHRDNDAYGAGQRAGNNVGLGNTNGSLNRGAKALK